MQITNNLGLHEALYQAIKNTQYSGEKVQKDYSVTELLNPTKQVILLKRYKELLSQDASDMLWSFMGTMAHYALEKAIGDNDRFISEQRLQTTVSGKVISGGIDLYDKQNKEVVDFKYTSAWTYYFGGRSSWEKQLNIYAYLLRENLGLGINDVAIVAIFRDFQKKMVGLSKKVNGVLHEYPSNISMVIKPEMWSQEECLSFLETRIAELEEMSLLPDDEIPICPKEERWEDEDSYAVISSGGKCYKKFDTREGAEDYLVEKQYKGCRIEERKGQSRRCSSYCPVKDYCNYGKSLEVKDGEDL